MALTASGATMSFGAPTSATYLSSAPDPHRPSHFIVAQPAPVRAKNLAPPRRQLCPPKPSLFPESRSALSDVPRDVKRTCQLRTCLLLDLQGILWVEPELAPRDARTRG